MADEIYVGVKFKTVFLSDSIPDDPRLEELINWCHEFHVKDLAPPYEGGSSGNLSFRLKENENEFIITGTQIGLKDQLTIDKFVTVRKCDCENHRIFVEGIRKPSSESFLHNAIYVNRPDVNAIFHGHSAYILSNVLELGLTQTKRSDSYGTMNLVESVLEILGDLHILIIKNHGFVSMGKTMKEAGNQVIELLEK